MQARVTRIAVSPDRIQDAVRVIRERPESPAGPVGLVGAYWFGDLERGQILEITFYAPSKRLLTIEMPTVSDGIPAAQVDGPWEYEVTTRVGPTVSRTATHARMNEVDVDPGRVDADIRNINEMVIPAATRMEGFQGGIWLADRHSGRSLGFTLWDSEHSRGESDNKTRVLREARAAASGARLVSRENFEILRAAATND